MVIKVNGKIVKCPECKKETRCWRKGVVPTRAGPKRRYVCFDCGRTFYFVPEPKRMVRSP